MMFIRLCICYVYVFIGHKSVPKWWLGLEDTDADGVFTWQDGSPVTYLDWGEHQPAHVPGVARKCVMMTNKVSK